MKRFAPVLASALLFSGCGAPSMELPPTPDAGRFLVDLGSEPSPDAEVGDLGSATDAGADVSKPDLGPPDAGSLALDAEPSPDAGSVPYFAPDQPGPYAVGVRTITLEDPTRDRSFQVDIWYPVDANAPPGGENEYALETPHGVKLASLGSSAERDGTPDTSVPRTLLIFSHGFAGIRFQSFFLTEHLASHGIVVAAPDHPGNRLVDFAALNDDGAALQSSMDRPLDMLRVLEAMMNDEMGLGLSIDPSRVISSGHSFGGWTSLEVARRDPRIRAVVSLAPGFREGVTPDFVAELRRPVALFGGSADETTPFDTDQELPYQLAAPPKILVRLEGAGHFDFSNMCDLAVARLFITDGCDPDQADPALVQARIKSLVTAFILLEVEGQTRHRAHLEAARDGALSGAELWMEL